MKSKWIKRILLATGLAVFYTFTTPNADQIKDYEPQNIPAKIVVKKTTLPTQKRLKVVKVKGSSEVEEKTQGLETIINTEKVDFSKDFVIETDRYKIIKKEEWLPSRIIGHIFSVPAKLYFWDWGAGLGLDAQRTKAVIAMLEKNKNIKNVTVRINHNEAIYDCYRLFGDDVVAERNNWLARVLMGIPTSIGGELFAELSRGDYYNPMNQTIVLYSNIESISGHEIGHHQDYQRFTSDWEYSLAGSFPPVKLYKEWQASINAKDLLAEKNKWQFERYLLPAFFTYIMAGYYVSKRVLQRKVLSQNGDERELSDIPVDHRPYVSMVQSLRHFATLNLGLYAGIATYNLGVQGGYPEMFNYGAFAAGLIASIKLVNLAAKHLIPYEHERKGYLFTSKRRNLFR